MNTNTENEYKRLKAMRARELMIYLRIIIYGIIVPCMVWAFGYVVQIPGKTFQGESTIYGALIIIVIMGISKYLKNEIDDETWTRK